MKFLEILWNVCEIFRFFFVFCIGVPIISNVRATLLYIERHVTRFQPINVSK